MPRLNESLLKELEPDIRRGLKDAQLRKKHGIPESTWRRWKNKGVIDRSNGRKTLRTDLLDKLREGREEFSKRIENVFIKVALGEWMYGTTRIYKDKSGEIIKTTEKITTQPDFKAAMFLLNYLALGLFAKNKKTEIPSTGARVPVSEIPDEWLQEAALQQTKRKQLKEAELKEAEKQRKQRGRVVKPIKMGPGIGKPDSIRTYKDKSGEIIKTVELTTIRKPNLKAAKYWLSHRDPEFMSKYKYSEGTSIGDIVPDPGPPMTGEEWLRELAIPHWQQMGIPDWQQAKIISDYVQNTQKSPRNSPKEAEKQPEQKEKDEAE